MTRAEKRIMAASRRAGHTASRMVSLYDTAGKWIGDARRQTCNGLVFAGMLDEDHTLLREDGHGDILFVRREEVRP